MKGWQAAVGVGVGCRVGEMGEASLWEEGPAECSSATQETGCSKSILGEGRPLVRR